MNKLFQMRGGYEWLFIPFKGEEFLVEVKLPDPTQLPEIETLRFLTDKQKKESLTWQETIDILNLREKCCISILSRPTLKELEQEIYGKDGVFKSKKEQLAAVNEMLKKVKGDINIHISKIIELQDRFDDLQLSTTLPSDTMLALTNIALGIGISDIQKMTKEKLLSAHSKARFYKSRPSDYVPGLFTDDDRQSIDDYAAFLKNQLEEKHD